MKSANSISRVIYLLGLLSKLLALPTKACVEIEEVCPRSFHDSMSVSGHSVLIMSLISRVLQPMLESIFVTRTSEVVMEIPYHRVI